MSVEIDSEAVGPLVLDRVYRAIEDFDAVELRGLFRPDAFVLTSTSDGVLASAELVIVDLQRWSNVVTLRGDTLRLRREYRHVGTSASGQAAWVFDQIVAETVSGAIVVSSVPIRVTALIALHGEWRIAAAYWSVPFATQAEQDTVKAAGALEPGARLDEHITGAAKPIVDTLTAALADAQQLPGLYSTSPAHVTIGSVTAEIFLGAAGRGAWEEFVQYVALFSVRGPMRAALVTPDTGWLAANIDIGDPPTPYRFFYIWTREDDGWRIALSHDAVSRHPCETTVDATEPSIR